ncbi:MAG: PPK2 family polyphosphate kinase [Brooklawnia sp.]
MSKKQGSILDHLRCPTGPVDVVTDFDARATPGYPDGYDKDDAAELKADLEPELDDLQERMYADGLTHRETTPTLLLILQGLDTSGKGGVIRHVIGMVDPQGVQIKSFKAPTSEEREQDFLWRIRRALPGPGKIGIFDRSHYEDVLIQRVEQMAPPEEIERRYGAINEFEAELVASGIKVVKCFLNVSRAEQRERLLARLENPEKYYKYNPGDVDVAMKYNQYMSAYSIALGRCNTEAAPWYVVPADRKWYRNWAIAQILLESMEQFGLGWPSADFDVDAERARVLALPRI